ncbi:MAG: MaoC family dehydratase [Tsuneonella sp.]
MAGVWFDELEVGQVFRHAIRRTVTETDNLLFTTLSHNPAQLHLDAEYMKGTEYGRVLVNSCFTLSLMVGVSVGDTTLGTAIANLGWDEVRFPAPVFVGDTLNIETEVAELRESKSRPNAGIVTFVHRAFNQDGTLVASCRRSGLQHKRPAA